MDAIMVCRQRCSMRRLGELCQALSEIEGVTIRVSKKNGHYVNGKSLMGMLALGISPDDVLHIEVSGDNEVVATNRAATLISEALN